MICFKVALHETDARSAAQEQRKKKKSLALQKKYTHKFVKRILPFFLILVSRFVLLQISGMCCEMGYMMPNVYQESCVAARVSVAPQGGA